MSNKLVVLEVAEFLDSTHAAAAGLPRDELRALITHVVELSHDGLGKAPAELDGEDVRLLLTDLLPGRLAQADTLAPHVERVLSAFFEYLEETHVASHAFERRQALAQSEEAFLAAVARSGNARRTARETGPFVHGAEKLGRNDPCSCGSGKKYKKCHGKGR